MSILLYKRDNWLSASIYTALDKTIDATETGNTLVRLEAISWNIIEGTKLNQYMPYIRQLCLRCGLYLQSIDHKVVSWGMMLSDHTSNNVPAFCKYIQIVFVEYIYLYLI